MKKRLPCKRHYIVEQGVSKAPFPKGRLIIIIKKGSICTEKTKSLN